LPGITPKDVLPLLKAVITIDKTDIALNVIELYSKGVNTPRISGNYCRALAVKVFGPKTKLFLH